MNRRRAFTLVEVLLAMTLAALMMAGVMTVIGTIGRDRARLAAGDPVNRSATYAAIDTVRRDLVNGRRIWFMPDGAGFVITGYGAIDRETLEPSGELARVTYAIEDGILYRRQDLIDAPRGAGRWTEIVATGASSVALKPLPGQADRDLAELTSFSVASAGDVQPAEGVQIVVPLELTLTRRDGTRVREVIRR